MTTFNVHIYREMKLFYGGIEADTHEAASAIARDKPTDEADAIDDCEGENLAALVDVAGDEDYGQSLMIDFEGERTRKCAHSMLATLEALAELRRKWRSRDEAETIDSIEYLDGIDSLDLDAAIASADAAAILSAQALRGVEPQQKDAQKILNVLRGAQRLVLDMGRIIRGLDDNNEWLEFWTNDGDYLCCDSRYDDLVAAIVDATAAQCKSSTHTERTCL